MHLNVVLSFLKQQTCPQQYTHSTMFDRESFVVAKQLQFNLIDFQILSPCFRWSQANLILALVCCWVSNGLFHLYQSSLKHQAPMRPDQHNHLCRGLVIVNIWSFSSQVFEIVRFFFTEHYPLYFCDDVQLFWTVKRLETAVRSTILFLWSRAFLCLLMKLLTT